jgi:hypothetical protein
MEIGATYCSPSGTGIDPGDPLRPFYYSTRIGLAAFRCLASRRELLSANRPRSGCKVCAEGGVARALEALCSSFGSDPAGNVDVEEPELVERAQTIGHRTFPLPPDPKTKREEVYAVAALSAAPVRGDATGPSTTRWLMVQRPSQGLLASQWEFPSALVWSSDMSSRKDGKAAAAATGRKTAGTRAGKGPVAAAVPKIAASVRAKELDRLLRELSLRDDERACADADGSSSSSAEGPVRLDQISRRTVAMGGASATSPSSKPSVPTLEHVFSHVRHTLWVEAGSLTCNFSSDGRLDWWTDSGGAPERRRVRWMTAEELEKVGTTACVRKILSLVGSRQSTASSSPSPVRSAGPLGGRSTASKKKASAARAAPVPSPRAAPSSGAIAPASAPVKRRGVRRGVDAEGSSKRTKKAKV